MALNHQMKDSLSTFCTLKIVTSQAAPACSKKPCNSIVCAEEYSFHPVMQEPPLIGSCCAFCSKHTLLVSA